MTEVNKDILYIRSYGGSLIPINKVNLVMTDPNTGKITQEVSLSSVVEKLVQYNLNSFVKTEQNWKSIEEYELLYKVK